MISYFDEKSPEGGMAVRKALGLLVCFTLIVSLAVPASAAPGVTGGSFTAAVSSDGNCQVTMDLQIHLEGGQGDLVLPLPGNARGITVNGNPARTSRRRGRRRRRARRHPAPRTGARRPRQARTPVCRCPAGMPRAGGKGAGHLPRSHPDSGLPPLV